MRPTLRRLILLGTILLCWVATSCGGCTEGGGDQPPTVVLSGVPPNDTFVVGETLRIAVQASDPEGGSVTFDWDYGPKDLSWTVADANFLTFANEAVFEWSPLASDALNEDPIQLIFIVTDVAGSVTEKVVTIKFLPGNGTPVFRSNASELYDPRGGGPIEFEVTVTDQDSDSVMLTMDDATKPPGSSFMQDNGPYSGTFRWTPTAEQLERRVYSANFVANDGQNAPVDFKVTIVIRSATTVVIDKDQTNQQCPGEAVIEHTALDPQRDPGASYQFNARLLDPNFDRAVLYVSISPPYGGMMSGGDEREGDAVEMENDGSGNLTAEIAPYTAFVPTGGALSVYYQICAFDDEGSGLDAIRCTPSSGDLELWHSFTVYNPDADDCVEDGIDQLSGNDDFATAAPINEMWDTFRVCPGNDDYYSVTLRDGESALFSAVYNDGANIAFEAFDESEAPVELKSSTCTGLVTAEVEAPAGGGTFYFKASGDNTNYTMRAFKSGNAAECSDASAEPNDDENSGTPVDAGMSINGEICPDGNDLDVFAIDLNGGDVLTVTHTFSNAAGNLDLTLFGPGQEIDKGGLGTGAYTAGFEDTEILTYTAEATGTYNLLVFNNNEGANTYSLQFEVEAAPPCVDNDGAGRDKTSAMIIPAMDDITLDSLAVCPGAPDWFQRTEFGPVLGEIVVTGGDGTIDDVTLTVYDDQDNIVGSGMRVADRIDFDFFPAAAGQFYYQVETTNRVEYEMTLIR